jgi:peptidoglycan hydrolase-like protein with peptidoglycan-binding domain
MIFIKRAEPAALANRRFSGRPDMCLRPGGSAPIRRQRTNEETMQSKYSIIRLRRLKLALSFILALSVAFAAAAAASADYTRVSKSVNLRKSPSQDAKVLKLVPMGYEVAVQGKDGEWTKVVFEGTAGYVKSEYLEVIKSASASAPSAGGGDGGSASGAGSGGALKPGDEGDAVKELQGLLEKKGAYSGPKNGKFGPLTEAAVIKFQEQSGLEPDGVVGKATLEALRAEPPKAPDAQAAGKPSSYRQGDTGDGVKQIQTALIGKGFYKGPTNGRFGPLTEAAVKKFQAASGLEDDGIVGKATLDLLMSESKPPAGAASAGGAAPSGQAAANGVELLDWATAKGIFTVGAIATVYDVRSQISYHVKSFSNGNHADVEPVTKEDTQLLKQTYGGAWSWDPRPVWVTVNGRTMAASTNGMPHASGVNSDNGMDGQICIHFKGSSTHNGNQAYSQLHQDAVMEAWAAAGK